MKVRKDLAPRAFVADEEYLLDPDYEYVFTLNGTATWQVWNGAAWLDYEESTGTSQAFVAWPPPTGRVQLAYGSGSVTASLRAIRPEGRTRQGN